MSELASRVGLWYNRGRNIVVSEGATNTTQTLINLLRRFVMDSLSPRDYIPQELPFGSVQQIEHILEGCPCHGKTCTKCQNPKCCGAFGRDKYASDGLNFQCKVCRGEYRKTYRPSERAIANKKRRMHAYSEAHREQRKAYNKAYNEAHAEHLKSYKKTYRQNHLEQIRANQSEWSSTHVEYKREYNKAYRQKHHDRLIARSRNYYRENTEHFKQVVRQYQSTHVDQIRAAKRAHREANIDHYNARDKAYKQANRDRVRLWMKSIKARRRALLAQTGGSYTVQEWQELKAKYDYTCLCCGKREPEIKLTADHVIPVTKGGHSYISNIQPLCGSCNSKKHNKVIDYRPRFERNDNT